MFVCVVVDVDDDQETRTRGNSPSLMDLSDLLLERSPPTPVLTSASVSTKERKATTLTTDTAMSSKLRPLTFRSEQQSVCAVTIHTRSVLDCIGQGESNSVADHSQNFDRSTEVGKWTPIHAIGIHTTKSDGNSISKERATSVLTTTKLKSSMHRLMRWSFSGATQAA